jgi:hypothetical protein
VPIDDPISAIQTLNQSDELRQSPVSRYAKYFFPIVKLFGGQAASLTVSSIEHVMGWLNGTAEERMGDLVAVLADEMKQRGAQIERLLAHDQEQRRFVEEELPGLTLDALRRAEQCRAKDRVERLAKILARAAEVGAQDGADAVETMMSITVVLSGRDVLVLDAAARAYKKERDANPQEAEYSVASRAWSLVPGGLVTAVSEDDLMSIGAVLAGLGLMIGVERQAWETPAYRPLERANKFLEYVRTR